MKSPPAYELSGRTFNNKKRITTIIERSRTAYSCFKIAFLLIVDIIKKSLFSQRFFLLPSFQKRKGNFQLLS